MACCRFTFPRRMETWRPCIEHQGKRRSAFSSSSNKQGTKSHTQFGPSAFLAWYSVQLDRSPLLIKGISSGLIAASGDFICQLLSNHGGPISNNPAAPIEDQSTGHGATCSDDASTAQVRDATPKWDAPRTFRFFLMGACWVGPATHYWYTALSTRLVPGPATFATTTKRLVLDQFGFAPLFAPSFMGLLWLLEGQGSAQTIARRLWDVTPDLIVSGWKLWIPSMAVNFSVVPLKYQVLFSNVVSLFWNVFLSYMSTVPAPPAPNCKDAS
jgi:Mpv17 / PMP22 family